jgi:DNA-binding IclR family transcriptional regulator
MVTASVAKVNDGDGGVYQLQSLDRAIAVLDLLASSSRALSLTEICERMDLHKTTGHRSLMVLERNALVERSRDNRYRLGMKLHDLGGRAVRQLDLCSAVGPHVRRLSSETGETVHVSILNKTSIVYLEKMELDHRVCFSTKAGNSNPVYCTSMGKAMLAFQPLEVVSRLLNKIHFVRYTPYTLCSRESLLEDLERVRRRGYAIDDQEIELGVRCIGVPVFDSGHRAIAAVSVSGPVARITTERIATVAEQLLRCCRDISGSLGSSAGPRAIASIAPFHIAEQVKVPS